MSFSPENVKSRISDILFNTNSNQDVYVSIGSNKYGMFVWDEQEMKHIHTKPGFVFKVLGVRTLELPEVSLSWEDLEAKA